MTIAEWLANTYPILERAGISSTREEIFLWFSRVAERDRSYFAARLTQDMDTVFSESQITRLEEILIRRLEREPLAYILGSADFWKSRFHVGQGVLIPRSDSEVLVEAALGLSGIADFPWGQRTSEPEDRSQFRLQKADQTRIFDLCTGSGCLGITVSEEFMRKGLPVRTILTDISGDALFYARKNIDESPARDWIALCRCDLYPDWAPISSFWGDLKADLLIANPPYINRDEMRDLMPEVARFEPSLALQGGDDGLLFYRRILQGGSDFLRNGGWVVFEHGYNQEESIYLLLREYGYTHILCLRDYGGRPRVTLARHDRKHKLGEE